MANIEAVGKAIGYLQGALGRLTLPKDDTKKVWFDTFADVSDADLEEAVQWYAKGTTERKWPLPMEVLAVIRKVENWRYGQGQQDECCLCNGLGLVYSVYAERSRWAGLPCMRPCSCGLGKLKAQYLGSERRAGRAWVGDQLKKAPPVQEEPMEEKPTTEQEEIPF